MLLGARQFFERRAAPAWTNPYVTDGLVAMWDGEWNAGGGVHDPNAQSWVDLTGNHSLSQIGADDSFGNNYFLHGSNGVLTCEANDFRDAIISKQNAVELVFQRNTQQIQDCAPFGLVSSPNANTARGWWIWCDRYGTFQDFRIRQQSGGSSFLESLSLSWENLNSYSFVDTKVYVNGQDTGLSAQDGTYTSIGNVIQLGRLGGYNFFKGKIYSIRIYSRALNAAEIAANYAIDKARFNLP